MNRKSLFLKRTGILLSSLVLALSFAGAPVRAAAKVKDEAIYTADGYEDYEAERARNKAQAVQTNLDSSWPHGPAIGAAGAVVMDADSGAVLYGKNMEKHLYPASITKLMTALLAYENLKPTDTVTFSENAVFGIERGSSHIGMDVGESITVEEALYGLMVASANEVAVALGERVSGSESKFVELMNERAAELGCQNTHFVTTNGLHDSDHYTCAYDMALIAREIFQYPDLVEYMSQANYHFEASASQPDDFWIGNTNDFLNGEIPCDDVVGGKTGYTDEARETLVTFAQRDGKRLVCVILREEPPYQYYDTIDLLDYAFDNFQKINVAENETGYTLQSPEFLSFGQDIFGNSSSAYRISEETSLMIPNNVTFEELSSEMIPASYETAQQDSSAEGSITRDSAAAAETAAAETDPGREVSSTVSSPEETLLEDGSRVLGTIHYKYHDYDLGNAQVLFLPAEKKSFLLTDHTDSESTAEGATMAAADIDLPQESTLTAAQDIVPEEVHGIRALFFGLAHTGAHGSIYVNILFLLPLVIVVAFLLCVIFFIHSFFAELEKRRRRKRRRAARVQREPADPVDSVESLYRNRGPDTSSRRNSSNRNSSSRNSSSRNSRRRNP